MRMKRGQRAAHCELEATSVNVTPAPHLSVSLQRKMLAVEGVMHVPDITLHHILQTSTDLQ